MNPFKHGFNLGVRHLISSPNLESEVEFWLKTSSESGTNMSKLEMRQWNNSDFPGIETASFSNVTNAEIFYWISNTTMLDLYTKTLKSSGDSYQLNIFLK